MVLLMSEVFLFQFTRDAFEGGGLRCDVIADAFFASPSPPVTTHGEKVLLRRTGGWDPEEIPEM